MARYTGSVCRQCRAEGRKLFLKGDRCYTNKCAWDKRKTSPGMRSKRRAKSTEYKSQLRAKQVIRRTYQLLEKQFTLLVGKATASKGVTGDVMLQLLETRLDNAVRRASFAPSIRAARQLVNHGHFSVNGQKVTIPSFMLKDGDVIEVREKSRKALPIKGSIEKGSVGNIPGWLKVEKEAFKATVLRRPNREEIDPELKERAVIEYYSR